MKAGKNRTIESLVIQGIEDRLQKGVGETFFPINGLPSYGIAISF